MRDTRNSQLTRIAQLCLTMIMVGIWGCSSEPVKQPEPPPPPVEVPKPVAPERTSLTLPPSAYSEQFRQANQLLTNNQWMAASELMSAIPTAESSDTDRVYRG